jgi:hypothetical protein
VCRCLPGPRAHQGDAIQQIDHAKVGPGPEGKLNVDETKSEVDDDDFDRGSGGGGYGVSGRVMKS